jgi:hypothetical protein
VRGHIIRSRKAEIALGVAAFLAGSLLIRDAYDGRGREMPWAFRPFSWW